MPVLFDINPDLNILYYACFGVCTADDFFQAENMAFQHELRQTEMRIIFDVRYSTEIDFVVKDIKRASDFLTQRKEQNLPLETTAVLSYSIFAETFVNAFHLLTGENSLKIGLFKSIEETCGWLGLSGKEEQVREIRDRLWSEFESHSKPLI